LQGNLFIELVEAYMLGLKKGNLETHVNTTIELQFNLNKEDFFKSEQLFMALRQLCVCSENGF